MVTPPWLNFGPRYRNDFLTIALATLAADAAAQADNGEESA